MRTLHLSLLALLLLLSVLAVPAPAESTTVRTAVTPYAPRSLGSVGSATAATQYIIDISKDRGPLGIWLSTTSTGPSVVLTCNYANDPSDTHVAASSVQAEQYTTSIRFTSATNIIDLFPAPAGSMAITATNLSTNATTLTIKLFHP